MSERKLKAWQAAGLIDEATAARISAWEEENSRPWGLWAIIGLGALTVGLGIVLVVASNWDAIPGELRLGVHFAMLATLGIGLWIRKPDRPGETDYFHDALLFVFGALGLTFFAHIGQVYQTSSPLWHPLLAWLVMFAPLLLGFGRGWPVALMFFVGALGTAWAHGSEGRYWLDGTNQMERGPFYWALVWSVPGWIAILTVIARRMSDREGFWRPLQHLALLAVLFASSFGVIAGANSVNQPGLAETVLYDGLMLAAAALIFWVVRRGKSGEAKAGILAAAAILMGISVLAGGNKVVSALYFLGLWSAVAYGAIHAGWRLVFQVAVAVLALRLIIFSFEFSDNLLGGGAGLIISGLVTLGVAWLAVRVSRKYAPKEEGEAEA